MEESSSAESAKDDVNNLFADNAEKEIRRDPTAVPRDKLAERLLGTSAQVQTGRSASRAQLLRSPAQIDALLLEALTERVQEVQEYCTQAVLFEAVYETGEEVFMICFSDVNPDDYTYVEGAVADALIASGNARHPLGILYLNSDRPAMQRISQLGLRLLP